MLYAPLRDLPVDRLEDLPLRILDLFADFGATAHDVECSPGQKGSDRIQVTPIRITAEASCFERDRAAAAERVTHARQVAKPTLPQFKDQ